MWHQLLMVCKPAVLRYVFLASPSPRLNQSATVHLAVHGALALCIVMAPSYSGWDLSLVYLTHAPNTVCFRMQSPESGPKLDCCSEAKIRLSRSICRAAHWHRPHTLTRRTALRFWVSPVRQTRARRAFLPILYEQLSCLGLIFSRLI